MSADKLMTYGDGYRYEKDGWIYLHTEGEPFGRGLQHGYLLANEIVEVLRTIKFLCRIEAGRDFKFFAQAAQRMFIPKAGKEYMEELKGVEEGLKKAGYYVSLSELAAWNGLGELLDCWLPGIQNNFRKGRMKYGCGNAFIASGSLTRDGRIVMTHNSSGNYIKLQHHNIISDIKPSEGNRIVMQCAPGHIDSCSSFSISSSGMIVAGTVIQEFSKYNVSGVPCFIRHRSAVQYGESIDSWAKIMSAQNSGGCPCRWLVGMAGTGEIACFELGLSYINLQKKYDGYFISFNIPMDARIRCLECSGSDFSDIRGFSAAQGVRWEQLMSHPGNMGELDAELAKKMAADHFDPYLNRDNHPCSRTICQHCELDACEFISREGMPVPYQPAGSTDSKVVDSELAKNMSFMGRFGSPCGTSFSSEEFLSRHPVWNWQKGYLKDIPTLPWTVLSTEKR